MCDSFCKIGISESFWGVPFGLNLTFEVPFVGPGCCFRFPFACYLAGLGAEGSQQQLKDANHDG